MKKLIFAVFCVASVMPAAAQETYENAKIAAEDLNGTARYVAMGGAMDALGAEISTMGTNPAGIGLFRRNHISASFGLVSQENASTVLGADKTNMSFDQAGIVISVDNSERKQSFINIGFNYHKSRNFDFILSAVDGLSNASQNKLTYAKAKAGLLYPVGPGGTPNFDSPYLSCNQLDAVYANEINYDPEQNTWFYENGTKYMLDRSHTGYIGEYDFNISGNINNRVYLGLTIGVHDVHYKHYGEYTENLLEYNNPDATYTLTVSDDRKITGQGYDVKAGIIFRPIEYSPFRVGLSVSTPTFYKLTTDNYTELFASGGTYPVPTNEAYDFKLYTPWKFGISLGHTIGSQVALGASYEYADYGSTDTRYITGSYYNYWYDSYTDDSESDNVMNRHTKETLKGVSTLKLGAEFKPTPELALRVGYNYVSPMYNSDGFKDGTLQSEGSYYSSATDFTNWGATNRLTAGVGLNVDKFSISAAYQYSTTSGEFHPFMDYVDNTDSAYDNIANMVKVKNNRHQLLLTLGYSF